MTEHARHTDPESSHEKMAARNAQPRRGQQVRDAIADLSHRSAHQWFTAKEITEQANSMFARPRQERDVSRTLTTEWREQRVVRKLIRQSPDARKLLHFRLPEMGEIIARPAQPARTPHTPTGATITHEPCEHCGHVKGTPLSAPERPWTQPELF